MQLQDGDGDHEKNQRRVKNSHRGPARSTAAHSVTDSLVDDGRQRRRVERRVRDEARDEPLGAGHQQRQDETEGEEPGELQGLAVRQAEERGADHDAERKRAAARETRRTIGDRAKEHPRKSHSSKKGAANVVKRAMSTNPGP